MELKENEQQRRYITFFEPDDEIDTTKEWFNSNEVFTPSLGPVHLNLEKNQQFKEERGMLITNKHLSLAPARLLADQGYYCLTVSIDGIQNTNRNLVCNLILKPAELNLKCKFDYSEDDMAKDTFKRYAATSGTWQNGSSNNQLEIFVEPDATLLSKLQFFFETED